jgi:hypothetical protein
MRIRWSYILPLVSLLVFGGITRNSVRMNSQMRRIPDRYFSWASFRLDTDPLNRHAVAASPCGAYTEDCRSWDLRAIHIDPGWMAEAFMLLSLPVFALVAVIVFGLGRLGINEVWSFMIAMPPLLFVWYYFIGKLIDRRRNE